MNRARSRSASQTRRTHLVTAKRRHLDDQQELSELWQRYRPLQPYLDLISPRSAADLLQSSRYSVLEVLKERYPNIDITLDGIVIQPLGLELV